MDAFPILGKVSESGEHPRMSDFIRAVKYFCLCRKGKVVELPQPKAVSQRRSEQQNRYLWALYGLLSDATGYTKDEWHDSLREKFLPFKSLVIGDVEVKEYTSTKTLSTVEFSEYVEKIREWQRKHLPDCYLPTPDEWRKWEEAEALEVAA